MKSTAIPRFKRLKWLTCLLFAFMTLLFMGVFSQTARAEEPAIEISSFEDLKAHLVPGEYQEAYANRKSKALLIKPGNYELTRDITIDLTDAYFTDKSAEIERGLLSFDDKDHSLSLDGKGHTINFTGQKALPLFAGIRASSYTIQNLRVEYPTGLKGYGFVGEAIAFSDPKDAQGYDLNSALIKNVQVKVNGNIESQKVWGQVVGDNHFTDTYGRGYMAAGFSWYLSRATLENIELEVTGNIGSDIPPQETDQKVAATGFTFHYDKRMPEKGTPSGDLLFKKQDPGKLKQAGFMENIKIHIGGNIQAMAYSHGYTSGVSYDLGEAWVENLHLTVGGDILTKLHPGSTAPESWWGSNAFGISEEIGTLKNSSLEVNNILLEADANVKKMTSNVETALCGRDQSKGWYQNLSSSTFKVKGKMKMDTPYLNTMTLGFSNGWSSSEEYGVDHLQVLEDNQLSVGEVEIKNDSSQQTVLYGLAQKAYAGKEQDSKLPALPEVSAQRNTLTVGSVVIDTPQANAFIYPFMKEATNAKNNTVIYGNIKANVGHLRFAGLGHLQATNPKDTPHQCLTKGNQLTFGDIALTGKEAGNVSLMVDYQDVNQPMEDNTVKARSLTVKISDQANAKKSSSIAGLAAFQQAPIKNCRVYVGDVDIQNDSKKTLYIGMGTAFSKESSLENSAVFIDKSLSIESQGSGYGGGFLGFARDMTIDNCDYQINGNSNSMGFAGRIKNVSIKNTRSLILNDWGPFVATADGGNLEGIAHYVNKANPTSWSALLGSHVNNQPRIKNSTLLVPKDYGDIALYRTANVTKDSTHNFVTVVGKKGETGKTNREVFTTGEKEITEEGKTVKILAKTDVSQGSGFIAKRSFQDKYWNEEIGLYQPGQAESSFDYLLNPTFNKVTATGLDADLVSPDLSKAGLKDYIHRHAALKTDTGAYLDLLGIRGDEVTPDPITLRGETALKLTKEVKGGDSPESFTFTLTPSSSNPEGTTTEAMTASTKGALAKDGKEEVPFGDITFTKPGTFTFSLKETGTAPANWTYDQKERVITVTVSTNDQSQLVAVVEGNNPVITNTYKAPSKPDQPTPDKPTPDKPTPDKPTPDKPTPDKPTPDKPTPDKPTPDKPTPDKPTPEKPTPEKPNPKDPKPNKPEKPTTPKPKTPSKGKAPKSGDMNLLFPMIAASLAGLGLVLVKKKRIRNEDRH